MCIIIYAKFTNGYHYFRKNIAPVVTTNIIIFARFCTNRQHWYHYLHRGFRFRFMVFNVTFNNISATSWRSVLLMEETGEAGENHRPVVRHWQTLSHNVISSAPRMSGIWTLVLIDTDYIGSCKSIYHTITTHTINTIRNIFK